MAANVYILDANVFIEAARRYYAFDLAPPFWDNLIRYATTGQIQSIDRIRDELALGNDELATWATTQFRDAFVSTDEEDIIESYSKVINWVHAQDQFSDAAKADFANSADGWLVAFAECKGCVIVTHELPATEARRKVPIPNVCDAFDVKYYDTFEMLRQLGVRFS